MGNSWQPGSRESLPLVTMASHLVEEAEGQDALSTAASAATAPVGSSAAGPSKHKFVMPKRQKGVDAEAGKTAEELALERAAAEAILQEIRDLENMEEQAGVPKRLPTFLSPEAQAEFETMKLRMDLERLVEHDEDAYKRVPIDKFGEAMLRGMGWKPGESIGNGDGPVVPIELIPRHHRLGLGAKPSALQEKEGKKRRRKPGEEESTRVSGGMWCAVWCCSTQSLMMCVLPRRVR